MARFPRGHRRPGCSGHDRPDRRRRATGASGIPGAVGATGPTGAAGVTGGNGDPGNPGVLTNRSDRGDRAQHDRGPVPGSWSIRLSPDYFPISGLPLAPQGAPDTVASLSPGVPVTASNLDVKLTAAPSRDFLASSASG